jgi:RNA polymerase sigma-70 factor (ECF subfamily)
MIEAQRTDGELLAEFAAAHADAPFNVLVQRHGTMVYNACRRALTSPHDAEDAAQAVFLVLAGKAHSLRHHSCIAGWLHHVAAHVCQNARKAARLRSQREREAANMAHRDVEPDDSWLRLRPLIDDELSALPEKYRLPLVLFHLEGRSLEESAALLECKPHTLGAWLSRGRELLKERLERRGVFSSVAVVAALLSEHGVALALPDEFMVKTTTAAGMIAAGHAATEGLVSVQTASLTKGALKMIFLTQMKVAAVVTVVVLVCSGISVTAYRALAEDKPAPAASGQVVAAADGKPTKQPLPAWRRAMTEKDKPYEIANTAKMNGVAKAGWNAINIWNGLSASDTAFYSLAGGGHSGNLLWVNQVMKFDMAVDAPKWVLLHPGTQNEPACNNASYYPDGLPSARHQYYSPQFIKARNRAVLVGGTAVYGDGNGQSKGLDAFDPVKNAWDLHNLADLPWNAIALAVCKHPVTEDIYIEATGKCYKWDQKTTTWSQLMPAGGVDPWSWQFHATLIDVNSGRNRWMCFGVRDNIPTTVFSFDLATMVLSYHKVTGDIETKVGNFGSYTQVVHDQDNDRYLTVLGTGLFSIDPTTWDSKFLCTVPQATNGVQSRLAYFQQFHGCAYVPKYEENVYFIPTVNQAIAGTNTR